MNKRKIAITVLVSVIGSAVLVVGGWSAYFYIWGPGGEFRGWPESIPGPRRTLQGPIVLGTSFSSVERSNSIQVTTQGEVIYQKSVNVGDARQGFRFKQVDASKIPELIRTLEELGFDTPVTAPTESELTHESYTAVFLVRNGEEKSLSVTWRNSKTDQDRVLRLRKAIFDSVGSEGLKI
jgi:hypothetical protein